jgi:hypothetical protein
VPLAEKPDVVPVNLPAGAAGDNDRQIAVNLLSAAGSPAATALIALAALVTFVIAAFAWQRRGERTRLVGAASRDFASVSLGSPEVVEENLSAARSLSIASSAHAAPAAPPSLQAVQIAGALAGIGDSIPRTKVEAMRILGMGVTADAAEAAIKRIVDGLRLSWHPDHAKDPEDRRIRELRVKQINAAWDIIRGKRAEA